MHKTLQTKIKSPADIMNIVFDFRKSRIILTAFELDLFTAIGNKKLRSEEVAGIIGADSRATDRLMNALCALDLLKKQKNLFSNSALAAKHLVKEKPGYLAGIAHSANLWSTWSTLTQAVKSGSTVIRKNQSAMSENMAKGFIAAMHQRAKTQAIEIAGILKLSGVRRVLDIGGGSGAHCMTILNAKKDCRAVIFDLPHIIPISKSYISEAGMLDRFDFIKGDFNKDDFGSGYDLILLSAIIHMNSIEKNIRLLKKAASALNKGGQLVIQDYIMNEDRTKPGVGTFFALNMLVGTEAGDTFTRAEVTKWMKDAELSNISLKKTSFDASLIIGWKK